MRVLVDNPLSPLLAVGLCAAGHDAIQVSAYGMEAASDEAISERARDEGRILVSLDTDFGTLLAVRRSAQPSVILLRRHVPRRAADQLTMLVQALPISAMPCSAAQFVVLEHGRPRVRTLPISDADLGR